jgi:GNAT superfamily N-acetyltransferase
VTPVRPKPAGEPILRPGGPEDYQAVLSIQRRAYAGKEVPLYGPDLSPLRETPESLAGELGEGRWLLVAEVDGRIAGSIRLERRGEDGIHLYRLSVDPDLQGGGLGQRLVRAAEEANPRAGFFILDCGEKSEENLYIYRKLGFRETGRVIQAPGGPRCLEMRKERERVHA